MLIAVHDEFDVTVKEADPADEATGLSEGVTDNVGASVVNVRSPP